MGTGGAYKFAVDAFRETTIVFNGDILTNLDVAKVIEFHRSKKSEATLTLVPVEDISRFGVSEVDDDGRILRFVEKPQGQELADLLVKTINAGIYILEPSILDLIAKDANRSFEYDIFPDILARGLPFFGYVMTDRYWQDIGTTENYLKAHNDFLSGKIGGFDPDKSSVSDIATRAEIDRNSVIGEGCTIKPGTRITNSVVGPGVYIDEKAVVENSVIWAHTRVSSSAEIRGSIIGRNCHIGRNVTVSEGSVLGDKTTLTDYTKV